MPDLTQPSAVIARLEEIERDLALRQNLLEAAAMSFYKIKRDREHARAVAFLTAEGTVAERNAVADRETALTGKQEEAEYESLKAVVRTLDTRASIGMAVLKSQGRF